MNPADKKKLMRDIEHAGYAKCVDDKKYVSWAVKVNEVFKVDKVLPDEPIVGIGLRTTEGKIYYIQDFVPSNKKEYLMDKLK